MARSKVISRSHHDVLHLHTLANVPTKYQLPTPCGFRDIPRTSFIGQGHYSKVKSRSDHNITHLPHLTNVPIKYQLPTPYGCRDIAQTLFCRSRSLQQGQRSNQCPYQVSTTYTLQFLRYRPDKLLPATQIWTPWVKTIFRQPLGAVG